MLAPPALADEGGSGCYRKLYSANWIREHEAQSISDFYMLYYADGPPSFDISLRRAGDPIYASFGASGECKQGDGASLVCTSCFGGGFTIIVNPADDVITIDASRPYGFFGVAATECGDKDVGEITAITAEEMPQPVMQVEGYFCPGAF